MMAGAFDVRIQTEEQFVAYIPKFRHDLEQYVNDDYLDKTKFDEGTTEFGNRYVYGIQRQKGKPGKHEYLYGAFACVWIKEKGLTVHTLFEGQGKMTSDLFRERELAAFKKAARTFCLSPH
jgi:hypothetical protein